MKKTKILETVEKIFFNTLLEFTKTEYPIAFYLCKKFDKFTGIDDFQLKSDCFGWSFLKILDNKFYICLQWRQNLITKKTLFS